MADLLSATLSWWWYFHDAYAPPIFVEDACIAASSGLIVIGIAIAIGMSVWRAREAKYVQYSWIDTAVNRFQMDHHPPDLLASKVIGIVVDSGCRYRSQIAYPDDVTVGLRIDRLGTSSARYGLGIFRADDTVASAEGHFVHVYVDRASMRPVPIPDHVRTVM